MSFDERVACERNGQKMCKYRCCENVYGEGISATGKISRLPSTKSVGELSVEKEWMWVWVCTPTYLWYHVKGYFDPLHRDNHHCPFFVVVVVVVRKREEK